MTPFVFFSVLAGMIVVAAGVMVITTEKAIPCRDGYVVARSLQGTVCVFGYPREFRP